jgi:hypothetical protein
LKKAVASGGPERSQILYNCGLCLWQLSFDEVALLQLRKSRCVEPLVDLLKQGTSLYLILQKSSAVLSCCEHLFESFKLACSTNQIKPL